MPAARHFQLPDGVHVLHVGESLTIAEARELDTELALTLDPGTSRLVVDLSQTRFAAGPALVTALRTARAVMRARRGSVTVVAPADRLERLQRLHALHDIAVAPTLPAALDLRLVPQDVTAA